MTIPWIGCGLMATPWIGCLMTSPWTVGFLSTPMTGLADAWVETSVAALMAATAARAKIEEWFDTGYLLAVGSFHPAIGRPATPRGSRRAQVQVRGKAHCERGARRLRPTHRAKSQ